MQGPHDQKILDFLEKYGVAITSTISEHIGYTNERSCQMRLKKLVEKYKLIKRKRDIYTNEYMFFIDQEPKQLRHKLILTNFYREMKKRFEVIHFDGAFQVGDIRPDGIIIYKDNIGKVKVALVEVQICHTKLDIEKYKELLRKGNYSGRYEDVFKNNPFPQLIAITNQNLPEVKEFKIDQIKVDLSDFNEIIGGDPNYSKELRKKLKKGSVSHG